MGGMGGDMTEACSAAGLEIDALEALENFMYSPYGQVEDISRLHMSLVALSFACNHRRTATLQWGDPVDHTIYDVPSNARRWNFSYIAHRTQSDAIVGVDPEAESAHGEIDVVRMRTLAAGPRALQGTRARRQRIRPLDESFFRRPLHVLPQRSPHHLGKRGWVPEAGRARERRERLQQPPAHDPDQRGRPGYGAPVADFGDGTGEELAVMRP